MARGASCLITKQQSQSYPKHDTKRWVIHHSWAPEPSYHRELLPLFPLPCPPSILHAAVFNSTASTGHEPVAAGRRMRSSSRFQLGPRILRTNIPGHGHLNQASSFQWWKAQQGRHPDSPVDLSVWKIVDPPPFRGCHLSRGASSAKYPGRPPFFDLATTSPAYLIHHPHTIFSN